MNPTHLEYPLEVPLNINSTDSLLITDAALTRTGKQRGWYRLHKVLSLSLSYGLTLLVLEEVYIYPERERGGLQC